MSFDTALQSTLVHEGGYAEPPAVEQPTNFGITQRTFDHWRKQRGMQTEDVRHILPAEVRDIYLNWYWEPSLADLITDESWPEKKVLAEKYFDLSVNLGLFKACELMQLACGDVGHPTIVDGKPGPNTVGSVNACDPVNLLIALKQRAVDYYHELVNKKPSLGGFLRGWIARAES